MKRSRHAARMLAGLLLASAMLAAHAAPAWQEGNTYDAGTVVTYNGRDYQALVTHTAYVGTNWNPAGTPTLWQDLGPTSVTPTPIITPTPVTPPPTPCPTCNDYPVTPIITKVTQPITPSITPTTSVTQPVTPVSGGCQQAWDSGAVYTSGNQVSYNGVNYEAKWWTQGDNPAQSGEWGVWKVLGSCGGVTPTAVPLQADELTVLPHYMPGCQHLNPSPAPIPGWSSNVHYEAGASVAPAGAGTWISAQWQGVNRNAYLRAVQAHLSSAANGPKQVNGSWQVDRAYWSVVAVVEQEVACPPTPTPTVTPTPTPTPTPPNQCNIPTPPPGFYYRPYGSSCEYWSEPTGWTVEFEQAQVVDLGSQIEVSWKLGAGVFSSNPEHVPAIWRVFSSATRNLPTSTTVTAVDGGYQAHQVFPVTTGGNITIQVCTAGSTYCVVSPFLRLVTPTPSPTPVTPTPTPGTGDLPKHALIGYWHNFTNPSGPTMRIRDVSDDWDVIMLSFAEDAGNGNVAFTLDPNAGTEAEFIADIAEKRRKGKKVVLSLGGQEGRMTLNTRENVTNFVNSLYNIITKYGLDGIDLDLESGAGVVLGTPIINNLITAMKELKAKVGPSFYLSMAPEHPYVQGGYVAYSGIWGAYLPIIDGLRDDLNLIHVQYYNNGGLYTPYSNSALNEGTVDALVGGSLMLIEGFKTVGGTGWEFKGLRPDQVAFGVPSGSRSANTGFVTSATVANALNCLTKLQNCGTVVPKQAYPTYRGVMTWSINWDRTDGYNFSKPARAALNALP